MSHPTREIGFPAKRDGWGWGLPVAWQGWFVLVTYGALLVAGARLFPPASQPLAFGLVAGAATLGLLVVCWLKGGPPGGGS